MTCEVDYDINNPSKSILTKFGKATINNGYYKINSTKEGNYDKKLHRLIFEDFYKIKLPSDIVIHHEDGNKLNNNIWNLVPMTNKEHLSLHHKGENSYFYGKNLTTDHRLEISKAQNSLGYFRVDKFKCNSCKNGVRFRYTYYDRNGNHKRITSVNLLELKQKVIDKGLEWIIIDEEKAKNTCNIYGYDFNELRRDLNGI